MRALLLPVLLSACAGHTTTVFEGDRVRDTLPVIALAEPVFVADLADDEGDDVVWAGHYVGNVVFSGGFEVVQRNGGLENVSLNMQTSGTEAYRRQIQGIVTECLMSGLGREGSDWMATTLTDTPPQLTRRDVRGTEKMDGRDNQPLPRFTLAPTAWEGGAPVPSGADALLVPYVVHYYAHNGGWFRGQTYGTAGGARVRVFWTVYGEDGRPLGWADHQARTEDHGNFSPNSQQIQDFLIEVEEGVCKDLRRKAP